MNEVRLEVAFCCNRKKFAMAFLLEFHSPIYKREREIEKGKSKEASTGVEAQIKAASAPPPAVPGGCQPERLTR